MAVIGQFQEGLARFEPHSLDRLLLVDIAVERGEHVETPRKAVPGPQVDLVCAERELSRLSIWPWDKSQTRIRARINSSLLSSAMLLFGERQRRTFPGPVSLDVVDLRLQPAFAEHGHQRLALLEGHPLVAGIKLGDVPGPGFDVDIAHGRLVDFGARGGVQHARQGTARDDLCGHADFLHSLRRDPDVADRIHRRGGDRYSVRGSVDVAGRRSRFQHRHEAHAADRALSLRILRPHERVHRAGVVSDGAAGGIGLGSRTRAGREREKGKADQRPATGQRIITGDVLKLLKKRHGPSPEKVLRQAPALTMSTAHEGADSD